MRRTFLAALLAASTLFTVGARAALTVSETEDVRSFVASAAHADRVRALVARPDLSADESAAAMTSALVGTELDVRRAAYLGELIANGPSAASRPVLAAATVRGVLARAEAVLAAHPADLEKSAPALEELSRAYLLVAAEVRDSGASDAERALLARALADHLAHQAALLRLDVPVAAPVARVRAIASVALYDALPDGPTRRIDAADKLGLTGARRAMLAETGVLFVDGAGSDARVTAARALLDRVPVAREGLVALVVGDARSLVQARGEIATADDAPAARVADATSPWAPEAEPPAVDASTLAVARGLAELAVRRAGARRPALGEQIAKDGGEAQVAQIVAMLLIDGPRTIETVAARSLAGKTALLASLADAVGVLAVFAPPSAPAEGLAVPLGVAPVTHVSLEPTGAVTALRLGTHVWRFERDPAGLVVALHRDGAPLKPSILGATRVSATQATSWTGEGLVFARLAGAPAVAIAPGPRVRLVGSSVFDAVSAPGPGDDVTVEADVRVDGGPAGIAVRTVPTPSSFRGVSLLLVPGVPMHAALVAADGAGTDTAAAPVVDLPASSIQHVRLTVHGNQVEARVGAVTLGAMLPADFAHGDVALRAYPGVTLEASAWRVSSASAVSAPPVKRKMRHSSSSDAPSDR